LCEAYQVPVISLQQAFAAATWSAGPPATQASDAAKGTRASAAARKATGCIIKVDSGKVGLRVYAYVVLVGEDGEETTLLMLGKGSGMLNAKVRGERGERKLGQAAHTQGAVS
jgi:hypothetical protein